MGKHAAYANVALEKAAPLRVASTTVQFLHALRARRFVCPFAAAVVALAPETRTYARSL